MNVSSPRFAGLLSMVSGGALVAAGGAAWAAITRQLAAENITVPKDADFLPGARVDGPVSAYAQAEVINRNARKASGGRTYAEVSALAFEAKASGDADAAAQYEAQRTTVMTASFLWASLFTSVLSYGVALMVAGIGTTMVVTGRALSRLNAAPGR